MPASNDEVLASLVKPGIRVSKLKLHDFPQTGRGLAATSAIRNHEILLTIPPKYLLNLKIVGKEFGFDWRTPPVAAHVALAIYILHHKHKTSSDLTPYLEALPQCFETVPIVWSEELLELLPISSRAYLQKQQTVFEKHYTAAQQFASKYLSVEDSNRLNRRDFKWAWLIVNSRCIYQELSPTSTRDDNYACSPLIDMINHVPSSVPHCKLSYDIKGLSVISQCAYRAGEETFISYGAHSNEALLCEYGFVVSENTDNFISVDHNLSLILQPYHQRLLMEMGYFEDYTINHEGELSFRTEVALRAALLTEEDCAEGTTECRRLTQFVNGYSNHNRSSQHNVNALLDKVVSKDIEVSRSALARCNSRNAKTELIRQIWRDRLDILQRCLDRLPKSAHHSIG